MHLPSLEAQQQIAGELDRVTAQADALLANARRTVSLASDLRASHLQRVFGSPQEIHRRLNPILGLGGLIELRVGGPADFYVQRSGGEGTVGRPFREAFPESKGGARRGPGDPQHHIGVTVLRTDVLDPRFLFYVAEYAWRSGIYRRLCHGTLQLQHLRLRDVSCGLGTVLSGTKRNPRNPRDHLLSKEEIEGALARSTSVKAAARSIHTSQKTFKKYAKIHGINIELAEKKPLLAKEEVRAALESAPSVKAAARSINTSPGTLKKYARLYGLELPRFVRPPAKPRKAHATKLRCSRCGRQMISDQARRKLPAGEQAGLLFYSRGRRICNECQDLLKPWMGVTRRLPAPGLSPSDPRREDFYNNPDEDLRRLERAAAAGDLEAAERLRVERLRSGLCPDHGLRLTGRVRRTCKACRAERKTELAHERLVKRITATVYEARRDRNRHPEGEFDNAGRWYPSDAEDADGDVRKVRSPSRSWPYSYMLRARTKAHCRVLVERALAGLKVPGDVEMAVLMAQDARSNPVSDRGRYRFVHACPAAHCGEDIQAMTDQAREIAYRTFRAKVDPGDLRELIASLGYDHYHPITRDLWHIGLRKSVYRGVPAVYLVHSGIEHIFTLDGELGPSLLKGPRKPDPIADTWQDLAQRKTRWGRFEL